MLWVTIYRDGPLDEAEIGQRLAIAPEVLHKALESLCGDGRARREQLGGRTVYRSESCLIPIGLSAGWEAALLDHYQALVRSVCAKLERGTGSRRDDRIGGSTYTFDVWPGHPLRERVSALLADQRTALSALWNEVGDYNAKNLRSGARERITFYFGQLVTEDDVEPAGDGNG
jgi:hypothetical protein